MRLDTFFATAAAFAVTAYAIDVTTSLVTLSDPGYTHTIPVGLDTSSTQTIAGWTVTGTATIVSGVAVIVDSTAVYMENLDKPSNNAKGGVGPQNTNVVGSVTVIGGTIQGLESATATATSSADTSTPSSGASRYGDGQILAMAGLGAAVAAVVI